MRASALLLLTAALAACSGGKDSTATPDDSGGSAQGPDWRTFDAEVSGPFAVGHVTLTHTYTAFEGDTPRTIPIDVWYPTTDTSGTPASYYLGTDELAFEDAALAPSIYPDGYPVHIHSHGYQGWGATSAFLMRHFASHGWIAVAPNHVGNLLADTVEPLHTAHYIHRPRDIQESLDALLDTFSDTDVSRVVLSGHSFGAAYTTWANGGAGFDNVEQACETGEGIPAGSCTPEELAAFTSGTLSDSRVAAIIPMAGSVRETFFGTTGYQTVQGPVMFLSGTKDNPESAQQHWDTATGIPFTWVSLEGGCHQTFALGTCDTLDPALGYTIVQTYTLAFARQQILGDTRYADLLDTTTQPWPEATAQTR